MKRKLTLFMAALFLLLLLPNFAKSQSYECTIDQVINGNNLEVSMYIRSTGAVAPALGNCFFSVNVNSSALNVAAATLLSTGLWTTPAQGANDYNAQTIDVSAANGYIANVISMKNGINRTGIVIPATATLIGTISIPITDVAQNSNITWREISSSNFIISVVDFAGTDITGNGVFTDPALFPLPVELISFTVTNEANNAILVWATASENNNSHFEIERSTHGREWFTAGIVNGHGTSTNRNNYNFTDNNVFSESGIQTYYYRLRQVDYSGHFEFSPVRVVNFFGEAVGTSVKIWPNPASARVEVMIKGYSGNICAVLMNTSGCRIKSFIGEGSRINIPVADLAEGFYIVRVTSATGDILGAERLIIVR